MHKLFLYLHLVLTLLCGAGLLYSAARGAQDSSPAFAFGGICLFGGMALAIRARSRWVLLPGSLLVLVCLMAAVAFAAAFVWPERDQNLAMAISLGLGVLEVAAIICTLREAKMARAAESPDS